MGIGGDIAGGLIQGAIHASIRKSCMSIINSLTNRLQMLMDSRTADLAHIDELLNDFDKGHREALGTPSVVPGMQQWMIDRHADLYNLLLVYKQKVLLLRAYYHLGDNEYLPPYLVVDPCMLKKPLAVDIIRAKTAKRQGEELVRSGYIEEVSGQIDEMKQANDIEGLFHLHDWAISTAAAALEVLGADDCNRYIKLYNKLADTINELMKPIEQATDEKVPALKAMEFVSGESDNGMEQFKKNQKMDELMSYLLGAQRKLSVTVEDGSSGKGFLGLGHLFGGGNGGSGSSNPGSSGESVIGKGVLVQEGMHRFIETSTGKRIAIETYDTASGTAKGYDGKTYRVKDGGIQYR